MTAEQQRDRDQPMLAQAQHVANLEAAAQQHDLEQRAGRGEHDRHGDQRQAMRGPPLAEETPDLGQAARVALGRAVARQRLTAALSERHRRRGASRPVARVADCAAAPRRAGSSVSPMLGRATPTSSSSGTSVSGSTPAARALGDRLDHARRIARRRAALRAHQLGDHSHRRVEHRQRLPSRDRRRPRAPDVRAAPARATAHPQALDAGCRETPRSRPLTPRLAGHLLLVHVQLVIEAPRRAASAGPSPDPSPARADRAAATATRKCVRLSRRTTTSAGSACAAIGSSR